MNANSEWETYLGWLLSHSLEAAFWCYLQATPAMGIPPPTHQPLAFRALVDRARPVAPALQSGKHNQPVQYFPGERSTRKSAHLLESTITSNVYFTGVVLNER